jgi:ArsR family metal-binding transcriptional regulator
MTPHARHTLPTLALLLCAVLLSGCAVTPQTPRESVLALDAAIESAAEAVATAQDDGHISDEQAQDAKESLTQAATLSDAARAAIRAGDETEAADTIEKVRSMIEAVRDTLDKEVPDGD